MFDTVTERADLVEAPLEEAPLEEALAEPAGVWLVSALESTDPAESDDALVAAEIRAWERMAAWVAAGQARAALKLARLRPASGRLDSTEPLAAQVSPYLDSEISVLLRLSRGAAGARLSFAFGLDELPATASALAAGEIDGSKARAIVEAVAALPPQVAAQVEAQVLPRASLQTAGQLRAALARAVISSDPREAEARHVSAVEQRQVRLNPEPDGMASLWALLPAPEATALYRTLTRVAIATRQGERGASRRAASRSAAATPSAGSIEEIDMATDGLDLHGRTLDQRRADALTHLVDIGRRTGAQHRPNIGCQSAPHEGRNQTGLSDRSADPGVAAADAGAAADSPRVPLTRALTADVQIVIAATTLLGLDDEPVTLAGYGPITAAVGRSLAADGTLRRLLTDPVSGQLLEVSRTTYRPSPALEDFIRSRDRTCRFPGCRQPADRSDIDHTVPYAEGGRTEVANLGVLCRHHHRMKTHAPGWHVEQQNGTFTWVTPTGDIVTTEPPELLPPVRPG